MAVSPVAAFIVTLVLAINQARATVVQWKPFILGLPGNSDFANYYVYARVGLHAGWSRLYDLAAYRQEWLAMGGAPVIPWFPIIYPPPLAWVVIPFTFLPLSVAFAVWTALLIGLLLFSWRLLAPWDSPIARWTALAATLALFPVLFALMLGQILIVELAAIALAWRLLQKDNDVLAGILLITLLFKPQVAFLVPFALLVIGRRKTFFVWAGGTAVIAAVVVFSTGIDGIGMYAGRLGRAAVVSPEFVVPSQITLDGLLAHSIVAHVAEALVALLTLVVAYRHRHAGPAMPMAVALVGSILATPYLHAQDLATLLVAGALAIQTRPGPWLRRVLVTGYLLLLALSYWEFEPLGSVFGPLLIVAEVAFLVAVWPVRASGRTEGEVRAFRQVPLDRSA
jgi:hypothetical protein